MSEQSPAIPPPCAVVSSGGEKAAGPGATAFTLYDRRSLEVSRGATPEALDAALAAGLFDAVERIDVLKASTLTRLPESIRRLSGVIWLRVSAAAFTGWETVYRLSSLESLVLDGAAGGSLPAGAAALVRLKLLDARAAGVAGLPPDLAELRTLSHVHVRPALREHLRALTASSRSPALLLAHHGLSFDGKALRIDDGASEQALSCLLDSGHVDGAIELVVEPASPLVALPAGAGRLAALRRAIIKSAAFADWASLYLLRGLEGLWISGKAKGALPAGIAALTGLATLRIEAKGVTALPPDLAAVDSLSDVSAPAGAAGALDAYREARDAVEVERALARFEAWLSKNLPGYLAKLRPGLAPGAIDEVERALGAPLPPAVRALHAWRDGDPSGDGPLTFLRTFLPLGEALEQWRSLVEMHRAEEWGKGLPGAWSESWFPLASWANGFRLCVDLRGTFKGKRGQVIAAWLKDADRSIVAPSLGAWWTGHVASLEAGEIVPSDGGDWSWPYPRSTLGLPGYPIRRSAKERP